MGKEKKKKDKSGKERERRERKGEDKKRGKEQKGENIYDPEGEGEEEDRIRNRWVKKRLMGGRGGGKKKYN